MTGVSATFANRSSTVPTHIKLDSHYIEHTPGRVGVGFVAMTFELSPTLSVDLHVPFLPIGRNLAVRPNVTTDGDSALRIDLAQWIPVRYSSGSWAQFPIYLDSQVLAEQVCRAFDADPATQWRQAADQTRSWLEQWAHENGVRLTT